MRGDVERWLASACADAERRGLAELRPLLEGLARSTEALREADPTLSGAAADPDDDRDHTP
ncbi:MAG TPA: hypothetical protein VGI12_13220 [Vicinamibacterales bacterium]|jgi:hypothetical protein